MRWHFYEKATGLLMRQHLNGRNKPPAPAGFAVIPGELDPLSQKVDITVQPPPPVLDPQTGADISPPWYPPVIDYVPPQPADDALRTWAWDAGTKRWVASPTLLALQRLKIAEMKEAAKAADVEDITLAGSTFAADNETRAQLYNEALVAQMALIDGQTFSLQWERTDGSGVTLTAAQLKAIIRAIRQRTDDIRSQFRARRATINAATTPEQVAVVQW